MRIKRTSELEALADAVWSALRKTETLRYVARPLLCFEEDLPRRWPAQGGVIRVERMLLLCVVPAWSHELRFVRLDDEEHEMLTSEGGGPIRVWGTTASGSNRSLRGSAVTPMRWKCTPGY